MFAFVTAALVVVVLAVFGGLRLGKSKEHYKVEFTGSVLGLEAGADVTLNGVRVGQVSSLSVSPSDVSRVWVELSVDSGTPVKSDTQAILAYAGITGLKVIDLRGGTQAAPQLPPGGVIPAGTSSLSRLEQAADRLASGASDLFDRLNRVADNLVSITDPARYQGLGPALDQARVAAENLARAATDVRAMVAEDRGRVRETLDSVQGAAHRASALLDGEVRDLVRAGSSLVGEARGAVRVDQAQIRTALFDLRQAARSLKELAEGLRERPSRLFFSRPEKERRLP